MRHSLSFFLLLGLLVALVVAPGGDTIGMIRLPEVCANVCFGGARRNRLFMTASQSLYAVYVDTAGAHIA